MRTYLPDLDDFFPKLRRGHGRGLGRPIRVNGKRTGQKFQTCQVPACGSGQVLHTDQAANIEDWEEERGITLHSLTVPRLVPVLRAA